MNGHRLEATLWIEYARRWARAFSVLAFCLLATASAFAGMNNSHAGACDRISRATWQSCRNGAQDEYWLSIARCENGSPGKHARGGDCPKAAVRDLRSAFQDCGDQLQARQDVCRQLGGGIYRPEIDPNHFVSEVTNRYFPLVPGTTFVYEGETEKGNEHNVVEVTHDTRSIMGVECVAVHDTVSVEGELTIELIEDTIDWYAQDRAGNVWYFGEESKQFEDGVLVSIDGSWMAGVDDAQPGIVMEADPAPHDFYRQEFAIGEAEDDAEVVGLGRSVDVPFVSSEEALETEESSALEPGVLEHKFYVPDVGFVLVVELDTGNRLELVSVTKD
jgi:hypothetical protein